MAMIRFTCVKQDLFAPLRDGTLVRQGYDPGAAVGRLGSFAGDGSDDPATLDTYLKGRLADEASMLQDAGAPVVVLAHGFLFDPQTDPAKSTNNPHSWIYHFKQTTTNQESWGHNTGWAGRLEFTDGPADHGFAGLPVAFGWFSATTFSIDPLNLQNNFYAQACAIADGSTPFARSCSGSPRLPNRIDVLAHSMGTQLTISALKGASDDLLRRIGRVVLIGGSAYSKAGAALAARLDDLGAGAEVFNIANQTDWVLENLARQLGPEKGTNPVIGFDGLPARFESWITLRLDDQRFKDWVGHRPFPLAHDVRERMSDGDLKNMKLNHWAYYAHDGNMRFYKDLFRVRDETSIAALRAANVPELVGPPVA